MLKSITAGHESFGGQVDTLAAADEKYHQAGTEAFHHEGLLMPSLAELEELAVTPSKKKAKVGSEAAATERDPDADDEQDPVEDLDGAEPGGSSGSTDRKWFDETHVTKSIRLWKQSVAKVQDSAASAKVNTEACLAEFQEDSDKYQFCKEIAVVDARLHAFNIVMNVGRKERREAALQLSQLKATYASKQVPSDGAGAGTDTASTATSSALAKAPPCFGFQDIPLLEQLLDFEADLSRCTDPNGLKDVLQRATNAKKLVEYMIASLRGATVELYSARTNFRRAARERVAAAEKRRKDMNAAANGEDAKRRRRTTFGSKVGVLAFEDGQLPMPSFTVQELEAEVALVCDPCYDLQSWGKPCCDLLVGVVCLWVVFMKLVGSDTAMTWPYSTWRSMSINI